MNNYTFQGAQRAPSLTAMTASSSAGFKLNHAWIMDTGATHHMIGEMADLNLVSPFEGYQKIAVGNGECLPIKSTGSTSIKTLSKPLNLITILHVPALAGSLLSVYTLRKDNNCFVILDEWLLGARQGNKEGSNERKE